ncbi:ATP19 family protein [Sporobolomyces koalae]|uniref:ATP19 family protein n=1 Tax=Sporobolomyces koalae TaxID=500713 RepID=UPI00317143BF
MSYTIAGKKILNEYIALGVYGLTGLGAYAAMSGPSKKSAVPETASAKANSTSEEETAFIQNFINGKLFTAALSCFTSLTVAISTDLEHQEKATAKH